MIKLYHGSNVEIDTVDLSFSRIGKDFGKGFYLNPDKQQALQMAERTAERSRFGKPVLNTFLFDDSVLHSLSTPLSVKIFEGYDKEWLNFILANRNNRTQNQAHSCDIVIGPIADDTVGLQLRRFLQGYIDEDKLIEELRFKEPSIQYFFGTIESLQYIKKISNE